MVEITTVSVSPESAEALRRVRDERGCSNMDEALRSVLGIESADPN